jgi:hypothetical protein
VTYVHHWRLHSKESDREHYLCEVCHCKATYGWATTSDPGWRYLPVNSKVPLNLCPPCTEFPKDGLFP